ncbi:uncharacterized protein LOC123689020 isoform X2 [Harmonia axyridis]|uniref:uncharacterized protein LOC123689020 isoform X2 n=1 Tax=Harmonia axyridis TaxID=115357 RepID=UPI001E278336|nr:uncharacterized protein LOC123689020 isoform X2 [Harmonia axyridis]
MRPSRIPWILLVLTFAWMTSAASTTNQTYIENENSLWYEIGEVTGMLLKTCLDVAATTKTRIEFSDVFQNCLRRKSLLVLNRSLRADVISVGNGIQLVKCRDANLTQFDRYNGRGRFIRDQVDWNNEVSQKLYDLFDTHELKINLNSDDEVQARHRDDTVFSQISGRRRKDNMMVSLLVFAIIAVGLIVIPMGFQFLAVLGGKALLLAKLALILSSIQGLKKIATSSLNYGLYTHHSAPGNPWHYDRTWTSHPSTTHDSAQGGYYSSHEPYSYFLHPRIDEE